MKQQEERRKRKKKQRKKKMKEKKKNKKAEGEQIPPPTKEFEGVCLVDTTVILAQPRVSRLRADAVYVEKRACVGEFQIEVKHSGVSREPPLFLAYG